MKTTRGILICLLAATLLCTAACGNSSLIAGKDSSNRVESVEASAMRLVKTEGQVVLTGDDGADIPVQMDMRLFNGNKVETEEQSLAGISLDETKTATLDEKSFAALHQNGKKLSMELEKGAMYFGIAKPLDEDESFEISTSTMTLGIRGTSGYVRAVSENECVIILTSGHAVITLADGSKQEIAANQKARIVITPEGTDCTITPITAMEYPALLLSELQQDPLVLEEVESQNQFSLKEYLPMMEAYRDIIARADRYAFNENLPAVGPYQYSLVMADPTKNIPALLLLRPTDERSGVEYYTARVRFFQYDPETGMVNEPSKASVGMLLLESTTGIYSRLYSDPNGNGILSHSMYYLSGTPFYMAGRSVPADGEERFELPDAWSGDNESDIPSDLRGNEIIWHDVSEVVY